MVEQFHGLEVGAETGDVGHRARLLRLEHHLAAVCTGDDLEQRQAATHVRTAAQFVLVDPHLARCRRRELFGTDAVLGDELGRLATERVGLVRVVRALGHGQELADLVDQDIGAG